MALLLSSVAMVLSIGVSTESLNEFDTYNAEECQRVRKPWHSLTSEERDLYISGLMKLRELGGGDPELDELIAIGSVHADEYAPFIHKTSSYLYWHGYLTWEIESRIRNLGNEFRCFGMPWWDFTLEAGREDDPLIFQQDIGGNGDHLNAWTVNEYSWSYTIDQYWTPTDCYGENDIYPKCGLKRSLRDGFLMPSIKEIGELITEKSNFEDFAIYSHIAGQAVHLFDDNKGDDSLEFTQSYEPIWYLFHSTIQLHQGLWTDCNNYDQIDYDDLDLFPEAFTPFCNSFGICDMDRYPEEWTSWDLDDPMHFGGSLPDKEWAFIANNDFTVRKSYFLPKWNIIYDLGNGDGFYTDSGIMEFCDGKLNSSWFILNNGLTAEEEARIINETSSYLYTPIHKLLLIVFGFILTAGFVMFYFCKEPKQMLLPTNYNYNYNYGSTQ